VARTRHVDTLAGRLPSYNLQQGIAQHIHLSAKTGQGVDLLRDALLEIVGWQPASEGVYMARARHLTLLREVEACLLRALERLDAAELVAEELRLAQIALNGITGEFSADDLLGEIFGRFCIGK